MNIKAPKTLTVKRYNREPHSFTVFTNKDIIEKMQFQILKWGNIAEEDGCVYGAECLNEETLIKAQIILEKYSEKDIDGYEKLGLDANNYIRENKINITCNALNEAYRKRKSL